MAAERPRLGRAEARRQLRFRVTRRWDVAESDGYCASAAGAVPHFDPLGVAPEPLERIERARLRREDMDDEGEEVHQDPIGAVVAFDVGGPDLGGAQRLFDRVGDRLDLPRFSPEHSTK